MGRRRTAWGLGLIVALLIGWVLMGLGRQVPEPLTAEPELQAWPRPLSRRAPVHVATAADQTARSEAEDLDADTLRLVFATSPYGIGDAMAEAKYLFDRCISAYAEDVDFAFWGTFDLHIAVGSSAAPGTVFRPVAHATAIDNVPKPLVDCLVYVAGDLRFEADGSKDRIGTFPMTVAWDGQAVVH